MMKDSEDGSGADSAAPCLLLIEDDPHVAETLAELLGLEGFRVLLAGEAEGGLTLARRHRPDLVLCDLHLGSGMGGADFARACRAEPALRHLRLVAVSGYSQPHHRAEALEAGFDGLIGKPVELDDVHAAFEAGRAPIPPPVAA